VVGRITQHSTGRQKQARFYQLANYWLKKVLISKENPFSLLQPVILVVRHSFAYSKRKSYVWASVWCLHRFIKSTIYPKIGEFAARKNHFAEMTKKLYDWRAFAI
jgi:hypothetical protein